ncbi:MAG: DUF1569 domain-containing protein [Fimbriiglobus sp.]
MTPARPELRFETLDEVVHDVEALLASGYEKTGNWSLGQCAGHLANWVEYQMDGFPKLPLFLKPIFFVVRKLFASKMLQKVITEGKMKAGYSTAPPSVPSESVDDRAEVERLRQAYRRWENYTKPFLPSPLFGEQKREDWRKLHLVHAAHHLGYLKPKA